MEKIAKRFLKIFIIVGIALLACLLIALVASAIVKNAGKKSMLSKNLIQAPRIETPTVIQIDNSDSSWQSERILYNGNFYEYNSDIITFLVMGIDKADEEVTKVYGEIDGGQADALFLVVFNLRDKSIGIIGINRNTMTDVDIFDEYGNYVTTTNAQIAVQHGFGDGMEESCELEKEAVSKLFYSLPIHGYAAINMSAIPTINDSVGGVDVTPKYSFTAGDYSFVEGETVTLAGNMAYEYLCNRDISKAGSSDLRLQRQKEYLLSFIKKTILLTKDKPFIAADIYNAIEAQMTTDITRSEVFFLSATTKDYDFSSDNFILMPGYTKVGDYFEEFYPDEDALLELMLDEFYEKVNIG